MGKYRLLLKAAAKKQRGSVLGILLLTFVLALCLFSALTVYFSGIRSVEREMNRLGFGDFTLWVSGQPNGLEAEIARIPDVDHILSQPLIFAGYEINGDYSDNEGQLLVYDGWVPYRFLSEDGENVAVPEIQPGTVYISPALRSMFDVEVGDTIQFELSRSNGVKGLRVAGYFADAFMGSSMIDMKSFLIHASDWEEMRQLLSATDDVDALGRVGAMFHIFQSADSQLPELEFHKQIYETTGVSLYTEFAYRQQSILNYMLLLQNILSGFLIAFSAVLLLVCLVIIGHSLSVVVEQEKRDMAVLKTMGLSGGALRGTYLALYGGTVLLGLLLGLTLAWKVAEVLAGAMVSSTGMRIELSFPAMASIPVLLGILLLFALFLFARTRRILQIAPVQTLRETSGEKRIVSPLVKHAGFSFHDSAELLDEILTKHPEMEFVQLQINYLDWESQWVQSRACYETAVRHGKPVIVMEPVKGGTLARIPEEAEKLFKAHDPSMTVPSWAVRFAASLDNVMVVLSGMSSIEQMADNLSFMDDFKPLTEKEKELCFKAAGIINAQIAVPCTGCSYCTEGCPMKIAIPQYFSLYNEDMREHLEEKGWTVNFTNYDMLSQKFGKAKDCVACGQCEGVCPQHLPIIEHLKSVSTHFDH